jgi:hypothetical protein
MMSRKRKRTGLGPPPVKPAVTLQAVTPAAQQEHLGRGPLRGARRVSPRPAAVLEVLGGGGDGQQFNVITRDSAEGGVAFMLKRELPIGQACTLTPANATARVAAKSVEVTRCRPISQGRYECAVRYVAPAN